MNRCREIIYRSLLSTSTTLTNTPSLTTSPSSPANNLHQIGVANLLSLLLINCPTAAHELSFKWPFQFGAREQTQVLRVSPRHRVEKQACSISNFPSARDPHQTAKREPWHQRHRWTLLIKPSTMIIDQLGKNSRIFLTLSAE